MEFLDLNPRTLQILRKANLQTFKSVLTLSPLEIERRTKLSHKEVLSVLAAVSHATLSSGFISAFQLHHHDTSQHHKKKLSVGCPVLDQFLNGGILTKNITEIAGESASGKTQLCLQLSLCAQLPPDLGGLGAGVAYICTEDVFPIKRLYQLIHSIQEERIELQSINFGHNIFIAQIGDLPNLALCLKRMLPPLLRTRNVKLIVIDSVAGVFRSEYDMHEYIQRAKNLQSLGFYLHKIALKYDAAVVCVNQVSDVINGEQLIIGPSRKVTPALGLVWANAVNTRLMLSRTACVQINQEYEALTSCFEPLRLMEIVYAPHLPESECYFKITSVGIKGVTST